MQQYVNTVQNRGGAAISGASVLVKTLAGAVATIYSDDGSTETTNPLTTDANGEFAFYAADGRYSLTISKTGVIQQRTISDILLADPDDADPEQSAADVSFVQSGSGAQTSTVSTALRLFVHTSQYDTQGNYETARDALTGTVGVQNLDVAGTLSATINNDNWSGTDLSVVNGGTGASSLTDGGVLLGSGTGAVTAMAVLADGEIIVGDGVADPVALAAFTSSTGTLKHERGGLEFDASAVADGDFIVGTGAGTMGLESGATARASLGLGSIATQAANNVSISGGSVTGITDITVADGGTGRSSHTAYAVICGGTTSTAAQQSIAGVGTSGQVLTSNGAGALPTFQDSAASISAATQAEQEAGSSTSVYTSPRPPALPPERGEGVGIRNGIRWRSHTSGQLQPGQHHRWRRRSGDLDLYDGLQFYKLRNCRLARHRLVRIESLWHHGRDSCGRFDSNCLAAQRRSGH